MQLLFLNNDGFDFLWNFLILYKYEWKKMKSKKLFFFTVGEWKLIEVFLQNYFHSSFCFLYHVLNSFAEMIYLIWFFFILLFIAYAEGISKNFFTIFLVNWNRCENIDDCSDTKQTYSKAKSHNVFFLSQFSVYVSLSKMICVKFISL